MPVDYFRRVPRDFTEGTSPGVLMSVVATCVMGSLFVLELREFLQISVVTDVVMDDSDDFEDIQINFDMLMPDLVCQYSSIDVSDMMGTNRQGITKNIVMQRVDSNGKAINRVDYTGDQVLEYEAVDETPSHDCRVAMYDKPDMTGWKVEMPPGQFTVGDLEKQSSWKNDAVESLKVDEGCVAVLYEHGDMAGWKAFFPPGEYTGQQMVARGAKANDLSSLIVVAGTEDDAKAANNAIEEDHAQMVKREAHELSAATFDAFVTDPENKMVVVDFYAPWCHWCQILEPTWKQVARQIPEKPYSKDTRVTKVNCEENRELCMKHNIRGYPTINAYMGSTSAEETYYGDRTTDAFFAWIEHEHKVIGATGSIAKPQAAKKMPNDAPDASQQTGHVHLRIKGDQGKLIGVEGCAMSGYVEVKRVPGNFHVQFTHESFNFENSLINATHAINHFSFGTPQPKSTRLWMEFMESKLEQKQLDGVPHPHALFHDIDTLDGTVFISDHIDRTYEHFIQVIPTIYRSRKGLTVKTYKYSVTSAEHTDTDKFPSAKFSYQISPMAVVMSEKSTPLYEFLTRSCAIVGGLFTVFSLLNAAADVTIRRFKGTIGKAA